MFNQTLETQETARCRAPAPQLPTDPPCEAFTPPPPEGGECPAFDSLAPFFGFVSEYTDRPFLYRGPATLHPNEPLDFDCNATCPIQKMNLQQNGPLERFSSYLSQINGRPPMQHDVGADDYFLEEIPSSRALISNITFMSADRDHFHNEELTPAQECQDPDPRLRMQDDEDVTVFHLSVATDTFLNIRAKWFSGEPNNEFHGRGVCRVTCSVFAQETGIRNLACTTGRFENARLHRRLMPAVTPNSQRLTMYVPRFTLVKECAWLWCIFASM